MAIPDTSPVSLVAVGIEVGLSSPYSLVAAHAAANSSGFDLSYAQGGTTLYEFRNYVHADTESPSTPTGLSVYSIGESACSLSWTASTDNVGIAGYEIYRVGYWGSPYATSVGTGTSKSLFGLNNSTQYQWTVRAYDAAGNKSGYSSYLTMGTNHRSIEISSDWENDEIDACDWTGGSQGIFHDGSSEFPSTNDYTYQSVSYGASSFDGESAWWYDYDGERSYEILGTGKVVDVVIC